jgi:hypothetical protein
MSSSVDAISIINATILTSYAVGQSNTAIKYSRAPIGNSIRIGRGNCIVKKVVAQSLFNRNSKWTLASYCRQELDKTDYGTGAHHHIRLIV